MIGRASELAQLERMLATGPPYVTFLHGVAGVGKTSLLAAFAVAAQALGARVIHLDCRALEPTDRGVLVAVARELGAPMPTLDAVETQVSEESGAVVLLLDHYEVLRLVDTWLRQVFVPRLPDNVRVVIAGREPPLAAWLTAPELTGAVDRLPLAPLHPDDAIGLFAELGVPEARARRLNATVRGHPLAIHLAAAAAQDRPDLGIEDLAAHATLDELTRAFMADVPDQTTREVLEAASIVRRITTSLLAALLPELEPRDALERLRALPFVETRQDGLGLHDAVRASVAGYLHATDPARHRRYRRAAWRQLREEVREAPAGELWRYTADMLYLIENPVVREAFFPSGAQPLAVEPARPNDLPSIELIARRHDGEAGAAALLAWYQRYPHAFSAIRDRDGLTVAFFILLTRLEIFDASIQDPVVAGWREHLRRTPPPAGQEVLGFRRWLDLEHGEQPSSSQAASWLDVKRTYMELRPNLRRIYTVVEEPATYLPIVLRLGFSPVGPDHGVADVGGRTFTSVVLDFGPNSVDGWLAGLVAAELGLDPNTAVDEVGREVRLNGHTVGLTPLEFGVLRCLQEHEGRAVSRATLLEAVWGYESDVGSNVVDVVVRRLRGKLGDASAAVETVRGTGYRLVIR
ncbi:MAG TPA: winged helix-turn-helix domain-containing protein [Candidatus Limnocylindrales bacterium]|nr:winged helix-turn-helix domain-containing protein [Candidatus Limnocylindrales bacterium]